MCSWPVGRTPLTTRSIRPKYEISYFCSVNYVLKLTRRVFAWYVVIMFGLILFILYPLFWLLLRKEETYHDANILRIVWAKLIMLVGFTNYRIEYHTQLQENQQYVICPNHSSMIDIPLAALVLQGRNFKFMGKDQLLKVPLFNLFFKTVDIPVNRESKIGSFRAFKKGIEAIDGGYDLIIFPEGTTSDDAPQMLPFKSGPFRIAIEKQIPVVPVTFLDNWHLFLYDGSMLCKPGTSRAIVHEPIETTGMTLDDADRLRDMVYDIIDKELRKAYEGRFAISR